MRRFPWVTIPFAALLALLAWCSAPMASAVPPQPPDGDADCSLHVDAVDALAVLRFRAGFLPEPFCEPAADVDCASSVTSVDALKIQRYVAGILGDTPLGRCPETGAYTIVQVYAGTFENVVHFAMFPGSSDEALVATQNEARLYSVSLTGQHPPIVVGDLSDRVGIGTQLEGMLSFAFSPRFDSDHAVFVYYTRGAPQPSVLSRVPIVNGVMDTTQETVILEIPQYSGYNMGGHIVFDSSGELLLSVGDAGGPTGKAQDINQLNGKVLRLRVEDEQTYSIPPNNPFVGVDGLDEIFAVGFRNPWRMGIDARTGRIWLGDVGELTWEEVNEVRSGGNYGWDTIEGETCLALVCDPTDFEPPRAMFPHQLEYTSITGGLVDRKDAASELYGWYLYANFYSGDIWALNTQSDDPPVLLNTTPGLLISSFTELPEGQVGLVSFDGSLFVLQHNDDN